MFVFFFMFFMANFTSWHLPLSLGGWPGTNNQVMLVKPLNIPFSRGMRTLQHNPFGLHGRAFSPMQECIHLQENYH